MTAVAQNPSQGINNPATQPASLQKTGGLAGIIAALTFLFGFVQFFTTFEPLSTGDLNAVETGAFLRDNQSIFSLWNLVIYVLFGIMQAVLSLALSQRLKAFAPDMAQVSAAFGLIWAGLVIASGMVAKLNRSQARIL